MAPVRKASWEQKDPGQLGIVIGELKRAASACDIRAQQGLPVGEGGLAPGTRDAAKRR